MKIAIEYKVHELFQTGRNVMLNMPMSYFNGQITHGYKQYEILKRLMNTKVWCRTCGTCRGPRRRGRKSRMDCCRRGSAATTSPSSFLGVWSRAAEGVTTDPGARVVPHFAGGGGGVPRPAPPPVAMGNQGSPVRRHRRRGHPAQPAQRRGDREESLLLRRPHLVASGSTKPPSCGLRRRRRMKPPPSQPDPTLVPDEMKR
jgi:hypothetical protein